MSARRPETPLRRLGRAAGKSASFLSNAEQRAGERLAAEFERAALRPSVTQKYDFMPKGQKGMPPSETASDFAVDCRRRFNEALKAVGPEFSGILVDICCLDLGLETVERQRHWPVRSAKIVLKLALTALARHYGYQDQAVGPDAGAGHIRQWMAAGARPANRPDLRQPI